MSEKDDMFFKTQIFSKFSHWKIECSFDNSAKFFSTKGRKFTAGCPKMMEKRVFFGKFLFLKILLCTRRMQCWRAEQIFFRQKAPKFSLNVQKRWKKYDFFKNKLIRVKVSFGCVGLSFDNPAEKIQQNGEKISFNVPKRLIFFSKKLNLLHWHVECSFDNSFQKFSTEGQKITTECLKKIRTLFFQKN